MELRTNREVVGSFSDAIEVSRGGGTGSEVEAVRTRGAEAVFEEVTILFRGVLIGPSELVEAATDCRGVRAGMTAAGVARRAIQGSGNTIIRQSRTSREDQRRTSGSRIRLATSIGIPDETFRDEIDKELVVGLENLSQSFRTSSSSSTFRVGDRSRCAGRVCTWRISVRYRLRADDEPKKSFFRELRSTRYLSGIPRTSILQASCSCSFSPGNIGYPVYISARMQPKLHICRQSQFRFD